MTNIKEKEEYRKVENDFYKCKIEETSLITSKGEKLLLNSKPCHGVKKNNLFIIEEKDFDASILSKKEIDEMISKDVEKFPFLEKMPYVMDCLAQSQNEYQIVITDNQITDICNSFVTYINAVEEAERNFEINIPRILDKPNSKKRLRF